MDKEFCDDVMAATEAEEEDNEIKASSAYLERLERKIWERDLRRGNNGDEAEVDTTESPVDEQSYQDIMIDIEAFKVQLAEEKEKLAEEKETADCNISEELDFAGFDEINTEGKKRKTMNIPLGSSSQENQYAHKFCVTYAKRGKSRFLDKEKGAVKMNDDALKIPEAGKSIRIDIQLGTKAEYADIWKFCAQLFNNHLAFGYTVDPHWYRAAFSMLLACMTHFLYVCEQKGRKYITTTDLYLEIAFHGTDFIQYFKEMSEYEHSGEAIWFDAEGHLTKTHPVVSLNAKLMLSKPDNEFGSIYSTLIHLLEMYFDPSECIYEMQRRDEYVVLAKEDEDVKSCSSEPLSAADSEDPEGLIAEPKKKMPEFLSKVQAKYKNRLRNNPIIPFVVICMFISFVFFAAVDKISLSSNKGSFDSKDIAYREERVAAVKEADDNIPDELPAVRFSEYSPKIVEPQESVEDLKNELYDTKEALAKERSKNYELIRILTGHLDRQQTSVEIFGVPLILTTKTQTRDTRRKNK